MTTKVIGIKEFRKNITNIWKNSRKENIRYIVTHHSTPILEVNPINEEELILEQHIKDIEEGRRDVANGDVYTLEEVRKILKFE